LCEQLADDPGIDAVFMATPRTVDYAGNRMALEAGKPVPCEKVFTVNATQTADLLSVAHSLGLFLIEAMWTAVPADMVRIREILRSGVVGDITTVITDRRDAGALPRRAPNVAAHLGGGPYSTWVYPLSLISHILGSPTEIVVVSRGDVHKGGRANVAARSRE
jgi:predicted dehydrogenase